MKIGEWGVGSGEQGELGTRGKTCCKFLPLVPLPPLLPTPQT
ncbi:hypothetical protein GXM_00170 [Nostoc sphaeroides CCNUC1]|uniref:Uncharacterized protein n=1 Tax=Nostoc sphaeroides CCNUC1 TaxID=2653204 RepID=A0A5P8VQU0_9NOSO|nr:hypothetical protein GXM_00170 [Nostoc sphaeroides CCNUC1]